MALLARRARRGAACLQLLAYPMLDDRTAARADLDESKSRSGTTWQTAAVGSPTRDIRPGSVEVGGLAAPARYGDISGLPRPGSGRNARSSSIKEGIAYASRLRGADVACELDIVEGAFYGFDYIRPKAAVSQAFRSSQVKALAAALT